jgi:hypothetical protein
MRPVAAGFFEKVHRTASVFWFNGLITFDFSLIACRSKETLSMA